VQTRSRTYEPGSVRIERVEKSVLIEELFNDLPSKRFAVLFRFGKVVLLNYIGLATGARTLRNISLKNPKSMRLTYNMSGFLSSLAAHTYDPFMAQKIWYYCSLKYQMENLPSEIPATITPLVVGRISCSNLG
jgi:hypothetical protein